MSPESGNESPLPWCVLVVHEATGRQMSYQHTKLLLSQGLGYRFVKLTPSAEAKSFSRAVSTMGCSECF